MLKAKKGLPLGLQFGASVLSLLFFHIKISKWLRKLAVHLTSPTQGLQHKFQWILSLLSTRLYLGGIPSVFLYALLGSDVLVQKIML